MSTEMETRESELELRLRDKRIAYYGLLFDGILYPVGTYRSLGSNAIHVSYCENMCAFEILEKNFFKELMETKQWNLNSVIAKEIDQRY